MHLTQRPTSFVTVLYFSYFLYVYIALGSIKTKRANYMPVVHVFSFCLYMHVKCLLKVSVYKCNNVSLHSLYNIVVTFANEIQDLQNYIFSFCYKKQISLTISLYTATEFTGFQFFFIGNGITNKTYCMLENPNCPLSTYQHYLLTGHLL